MKFLKSDKIMVADSAAWSTVIIIPSTLNHKELQKEFAEINIEFEDIQAIKNNYIQLATWQMDEFHASLNITKEKLDYLKMEITKAKQQENERTGTLSSMSYYLPAVNVMVDFPCSCNQNGQQDTLRSIIMHLNDFDKWSRERIADWLDSLHESGKVNLDFQPWEVKE